MHCTKTREHQFTSLLPYLGASLLHARARLCDQRFQFELAEHLCLQLQRLVLLQRGRHLCGATCKFNKVVPVAPEVGVSVEVLC